MGPVSREWSLLFVRVDMKCSWDDDLDRNLACLMGRTLPPSEVIVPPSSGVFLFAVERILRVEVFLGVVMIPSWDDDNDDDDIEDRLESGNCVCKKMASPSSTVSPCLEGRATNRVGECRWRCDFLEWTVRSLFWICSLSELAAGSDVLCIGPGILFDRCDVCVRCL